MAGKTTPTVMDIRPRKVADAVGAGIPRRDAPEKARGEAQYVADMRRPNMLFGKAVRSPYPHARVKKIDATRALAHPGVVSVLTARDIPGKNVTGARAVKDQPVLAPGVVMFTGEAVALVVAETEPAAREGAKLVRVSYEPLPVVDDPENALVPGSPLLREKSNLCHEFKIIRGDFEAARKQADFEITRTYRTQMVDHSALEPDSSLAEPDGDGLQVWVSSKGVHVDQGEVARVLGLPLQKIRVVAATIGGSFGSKPDLPTVCMAALITLKTGRPAKVTLTREECFLAKTKRHPYVFKYTYAVRRDGKILGAQVDAIADAGAYASFTPTVITKGLIHATGPYVVPNVHLTVRAAFTNNPVTGAMRGYGEPQYTFAVERHMDVIARQLDLDPWELRMRNAFRQGDLTITGQRLIHAPMLELLEASRRRVRELDELDRAEGRLEKNVRYQRAWGIAACHSGLGRTGVADNAEVTLRLEPDGVFHLFVGCPDTGQGSDTGMVQIAAQELGVPLDLVRITSADTFLTRDAGTTTATRVTYIVGSAVQQAAKELRARLLGAAESKEGFGVASLEHDRR